VNAVAGLSGGCIAVVYLRIRSLTLARRALHIQHIVMTFKRPILLSCGGEGP